MRSQFFIARQEFDNAIGDIKHILSVDPTNLDAMRTLAAAHVGQGDVESALEQIDKMIELSVKYFPDLHGMSFLVGVSKQDAPLYSAMLGAMKVDDARAYLEKYRKYWQELDEIIGDTEGSFLKDIELEDITLDGVSMLKFKMPIPGLQGLGLPNGQLDGLMEKIYGPGGMTIYLAAADDQTVLMGYTDPALLQKTLQAAQDKTLQLSQDPNIQHTSQLLPPGAHAVGYWSPSGTMAFVNSMIQLFAGTDQGIQLPAFPPTPPVGWSLRATKSAVKIDTVLPAEALEAVGGFVGQVQQLNRAGAN